MTVCPLLWMSWFEHATIDGILPDVWKCSISGRRIDANVGKHVLWERNFRANFVMPSVLYYHRATEVVRKAYFRESEIEHTTSLSCLWNIELLLQYCKLHKLGDQDDVIY